MRSILHELKRRKAVRVATVYAATAFVVLQGADLILPGLLLPEWTYRMLVLLGLFGFPVALVLAWAFERTPEGVRRTTSSTAAAGETPPALLGRRTIIATALLLMLGIGLGAGLVLAPATERESGASFAGKVIHDVADRSIAVLPFADLSEAAPRGGLASRRRPVGQSSDGRSGSRPAGQDTRGAAGPVRSSQSDLLGAAHPCRARGRRFRNGSRADRAGTARIAGRLPPHVRVVRRPLAGDRDGVLEHLTPVSEQVGYAAAVRGDVETARARARAYDAARHWPDARLLLVYHQLGDRESSRELVRRIDALPAGPAVLARELTTVGRVLTYDLADAPNFAARLREAGVDAGSLRTLPPLLAPQREEMSDELPNRLVR